MHTGVRRKAHGEAHIRSRIAERDPLEANRADRHVDTDPYSGNAGDGPPPSQQRSCEHRKYAEVEAFEQAEKQEDGPSDEGSQTAVYADDEFDPRSDAEQNAHAGEPSGQQAHPGARL